MLEAAVTALLGLCRSEPRHAMSAREARSWASSAVKWLERGMSPGEMHRTLTLGMDTVRSLLGVLDWRLRHALPDVAPGQEAKPRPEPRVAHMRECAGEHTQPRLFTPESGTDDTPRCPECRQSRTDSGAEASAGPSSGPSAEPAAAAAQQGPGFAGYRAARTASRRGRKTRTTTAQRALGAYGINSAKWSSRTSPVSQDVTH